MHIRIFHQYFRTPETGGSLRSYFIARELVRKGFEVSVITATNRSNAHTEELEGFRVHYLPVYYTNHLGFLSRIRAFLRFVNLAVNKSGLLGSADLNYVISTPLSTGLIGLYEKRFRATDYIFEVGDIWPEAPIQLNVLRNPILKIAARKLESLIYRNAWMLVGLSDDISKHISEKAGRNDVFTITNFSEGDSLSCSQPVSKIRASIGLKKQEFVIAYTGTLGRANHLEFLVDFAKVIPENLHVKIIIMGEGAREKQLKDYSAKMRMNERIQFIGSGDRSRVACILSAADAVYISFDQAPVLQTGCPNKLFDALALGKLVIINFGGWIDSLISANNIGFSYHPGEEKKAVKRLINYMDPDILEGVKRRGRQLSESYTAQNQLTELIHYLEKKKKAG
ncbi:MAG: glycosyltransferase family 4 protein [Cyclobacteriaceae bacterium]